MSDPLPLPDGLMAGANAAQSRLLARPSPPRIRIEKGAEGWQFTCPYGDEHGPDWIALLCDAFGTRHGSVVDHFLGCIVELVPEGKWNGEKLFWYPDEAQFNAVLAIISSLRPDNEAQAAYAAQLAALHLSAMKLAEHTSRYGGDPRATAILAKTTRAYGDGLERMAKLQGKIQPRTVNQIIEVHKHEHVHFNGGVSSNGGQPQEPYGHNTATHSGRGHERCAALPSPCEVVGQAVPVSGGQGQACLPRSWRSWWRSLWRA